MLCNECEEKLPKCECCGKPILPVTPNWEATHGKYAQPVTPNWEATHGKYAQSAATLGYCYY